MQRFEVHLEDDLTGGQADETVRFGLEGTTYELDLSAQHAADLRRRLAPFVEHARPVGRRRSRGPVRTASTRQRSREIRAWAGRQGFAVSDHGRLPTHVIQQYESALDVRQPAGQGERRSSDGRGRR